MTRPNCTAFARTRWLAAVAAVALLGLPASAFAQKKPAKSEGKGRTLEFEDDVIETTLLRPETTQVETLNKNKRASLIRIRMNFFAEIIRSAEDL